VLKRLFALFFGLGLGLLVGAVFVRRVDRAAQAVAPGNLAAQAGRAAGGMSAQLRAAWEETRRVAAEREAELRAEFGVPTARQLLEG